MKITPRPLPRKAAEKLVAFLPFFQENDTFKHSCIGVDGNVVYGIYDTEYSTKLNEFIELYNSSFVAVYFDTRGDWELDDRSEEFIANPKLIATIDLLTLRMLFANITYVKNEYPEFNMYIMNADIIVCMLLRLEELMYNIPLVTKENEVWLDKIIAWADKKGIEDYHTTPNTLNMIWVGLPRDKDLLLNSYTLNIGWNDLGELPKEIGNLTNLIEIRAWCSNLTKLPKEIGNLVNLRELSLDENKLTQLPKEIERLSKLEILSLCSNPIREFPIEITNLSNLKELNMGASCIYRLPGEIGKLKKLKELRIEESKDLIELSKEIGELSDLETLYIWDCGLVKIPKEIEKLKNLTHLTLASNNLIEIPSEICNISNLISFDAGYNKILKIPKEIVKLSNLTSFDIHNNNLTEIPIEVNQLTLKHFCFYENPLIEVAIWLKVKAKTLCSLGKQ